MKKMLRPGQFVTINHIVYRVTKILKPHGNICIHCDIRTHIGTYSFCPLCYRHNVPLNCTLKLVKIKKNENA